MPVFNPKGAPQIFNGGGSATGAPRGQRATFMWNTQGRGVPRRDDLFTARVLEKSHTVSLPMDTIETQISTTPWAIRPTVDDPDTAHEEAADDAYEWLDGDFNPNSESFDHFIKEWVGDILSIDAGTVELVPDDPEADTPLLDSMYVRDGATFVKNPDKHGRMPSPDSERPAYYQFSLAGSQQPVRADGETSIRDLAEEVGALGYGLKGHEPVPFSRDAIMWAEESPRSWSPYGFGRVQKVQRIVEVLLNQDVSNRQYFDVNEIPEGVLSLVDANQKEVTRTREYWNDEIKGEEHKLPILGSKADYQTFRASPSELDFLESQKWYHKLVWMVFGLSQSEVGHIEDVNRAAGKEANIAVWRRTTKPLLNLLEEHINNEILPFLEEYHRVDGEIEFTWNFDNPEIEERQREQQRQELQAGTVTVNEVRQDRGKEPVEWGDWPQSLTKSIARNNPTWFLEQLGVEEPPEPSNPLGGGGGDPLGLSAGETRGDTVDAVGSDLLPLPAKEEDPLGGELIPLGAVGKGDDSLRDEHYEGQYPPLAGHAEELETSVAARYEDQLDDLLEAVEAEWPDVPDEQDATPEGETKRLAFDLENIVDTISLSSTLTSVVQDANLEAMGITADWEAGNLEEQLEESVDEDDADVSIAFDVEDTYAAEHMRRNAAQDMVTVESTVKSRIRRALVDVQEEGGNVTDATRELRETFDELTDSHARLVSRTETLGSSRHGSQALAESSDVVGGKKWLASDDGRTRAWHEAMDGEIVGVDDDFTVPSVGDDDQPADYPRSAHVVGEDQPFNCRCVQQSVLAEDMPDDAQELASVDGVTVKVGGRALDGLTARQREIKTEHAADDETFVEFFDRTLGEHSKTSAAKALGISKHTLYKWGDNFADELENYDAR